MDLLEEMERRGWVSIVTWDDNDSLAPANAEERQESLAAYERALFPDLDYVSGSIDYLLPDATGLHVVITAEGKAEYLRREGPTGDDYWQSEGPNGGLSVWAKTEEVADQAASDLLREREVEQRTVIPCTFEITTGEKIDGVRVIYRLRPSKAPDVT